MAETLSNDQAIESLKFAFDLGAGQRLQTIEGTSAAVHFAQRAQIVDLEQYLPTPNRTKREPKFVDVVSFAEYFLAFREPGTQAFGSLQSRRVEAIFDYPTRDERAWGDHKAVLLAQVTPEWSTWAQHSGTTWFNQIAFAEFLEEWNHVVVSPDAARICEIAMNLEVP